MDTYNKNWIYRPDDWLLANRWEELVTNRDLVDMVEVGELSSPLLLSVRCELRLILWFVRVVTWNDYSESSYVTGIKGSLPLNSDEWVTGYDHTSQYILSYLTTTLVRRWVLIPFHLQVG